MTNLAGFLTESANKFPDRDALVLGDVRLTYAQTNTFANMCANLLVSRGIGPGDVVALSCANLPYFSIVYNGILKTGATVLPLNILLAEREVAYHLADSGAKAYFCFEGVPGLPIGENGHAGFLETDTCEHFFMITADLAAPSPIEGTETLAQAMGGQSGEFADADVADSDTAVILYTSGTTGQPKGAELTHDNMRSNALACQEIFGAAMGGGDGGRFLCTLPMFHAFGQTVNQNFGFSRGATLVLVPRFEAEAALHLLDSEEIDFFSGVPTMYWGLLGALETTAADVHGIAARLNVAIAGGAALPQEVHRKFEAKFGVTIMEGYGLSETSPVASFSVMGEPARVGSIGRPIPGVQMKLINDDWSDAPAGELGEIAIKGPNVMKGYLGRPDATAEAIREGWFRSGDLARTDSDGWYYIVDRSKDMIIRGGFNVYPRELEEVLMTHPDVSLAAVIGVSSEEHGEEIKAFLILNPGAAATADDLKAWGKEQFAKYKYPRLVEIVAQLPMTATGKILKRELS